MTQQTWSAVDDYFDEQLRLSDPILAAALVRSAEAGLPPINVTPNAGKLLHILARFGGARRILEIGTLGGYSTIWLARALPADGRLITLEADPAHAEVARANLEAAGVSVVVEIRLGKALETLPVLAAEEVGPFDLIFIDADKPSNPAYVEWALRLTRPGSLILIDNVVRDGRVLEADGGADVIGVRQALAILADRPGVSTTAMQTVGGKGYDGLAIALVTGDA